MNTINMIAYVVAAMLVVLLLQNAMKPKVEKFCMTQPKLSSFYTMETPNKVGTVMVRPRPNK